MPVFQQKKFLIPAAILALVVIWYLAFVVAWGPHDYTPAPTTQRIQDQFQYRVPLDPQSPWPKFRANALQNGRSPVSASVDSSLKPWQFQTGKGIFSAPVVDGDGNVYVGSADHYFYKLSQDGRLIWKFATGEIIDSSALLDDEGRVIFGSGDGHVYALDVTSGKELWRFQADTTAQVKEKYGINPVNVNWFEGNTSITSDGTILAPNDNYLVYAIDRSTGKEKTQYFGNEMIWSAPAINPETNQLFFSTSFIALQNLYRYDLNTGKKQWTSGGLGSHAASILLSNTSEDALLVAGAFDGYVRAYSQKSGKQIWKFGSRDHIYASPAQLSDGTIIQPSADGSVYAIDAKTGSVKWSFDTLEPIRSSPAVDANDIIYVGSGQGKLYAINPDGSLRWAYKVIQEPRNDLNSSPALGHKGVYIAGENGGIFFVPYDYPLTDAGQSDPNAITPETQTPLPNDGASFVYISRFGSFDQNPPDEIDANESLAFALLVRESNRTIPSAIDSVSIESNSKGRFVANRSADGRFMTIIPQETWQCDNDRLDITITVTYRKNLSRFGLKFFGGSNAGSFEQSYSFQLRQDKLAKFPFLIPSKDQPKSDVIEMSRLAVPSPTMLPSWNQIGFDSLHYLIGMVDKTESGIVAWVVPARLDEKTHQSVVDPSLNDVYPLLIDYDNGLITLYNYDGFKISFVGTWDMPFGFYRIASRIDDLQSFQNQPASLNAIAKGNEIKFYGNFLKLMGITDLKTGLLHAYGGLNLSQKGNVSLHDITGNMQFKKSDVRFLTYSYKMKLEIDNSAFKKSDHVYGILLTDEKGHPIAADYSRSTKITTDEDGNVTEIEVAVSEEMSFAVRYAYFMVDTYPVAKLSAIVDDD